MESDDLKTLENEVAILSVTLIFTALLSSISSGDKIGIKGNLVTIEKNHPFLWMKRKYYG